jgi:hypothetical protein
LADRVLVKIAAAETKTTGGIILAESAQRKPTSGASNVNLCFWDHTATPLHKAPEGLP